MVQKLQIECGHNTVNKIKTMISDMAKSGEIGNESVRLMEKISKALNFHLKYYHLDIGLSLTPLQSKYLLL